jgi:hypothetical protein
MPTRAQDGGLTPLFISVALRAMVCTRVVISLASSVRGFRLTLTPISDSWRIASVVCKMKSLTALEMGLREGKEDSRFIHNDRNVYFPR